MEKHVENKITGVTRRKISELFTFDAPRWYGVLDQCAFLEKFYDLDRLDSSDFRFHSARDDIYQHTVRNWRDWPGNWVFTDPRFKLKTCGDDAFLNFLVYVFAPDVVVHNVVEGSAELTLLKQINVLLHRDGYEIYQDGEESGAPIFKWHKIDTSILPIRKQQEDIIQAFNTEYITRQVDAMEKLVSTNPTDAIGKARELVESCCKTILERQQIAVTSSWDCSRLFKEACKYVKKVPNAPELKDADHLLGQLSGSLSGIVGALAELRNKFGGGHGKSASFVGLDQRCAELTVGAATVLVRFLWASYQHDKTA